MHELASKNKQANEIKELFDCYQTKLYCLFLKSVLPTCLQNNMRLQKEVPMIHMLNTELQHPPTPPINGTIY